MLRLLFIAALVGLPAAASAEKRVYSGAEAQAIQCAAYYSQTTRVLERRGLVTARDREMAEMAATHILLRHVTGGYDQRVKAVGAALRSLPQEDMAFVAESARYLDWCRLTFLSE